jgi:hypothetical protein
MWWRPQIVNEQTFTVLPLDRSWNAFFRFEAGQETLAISKVSDIEVTKSFMVLDKEREYSVRLHMIPKAVTEPAMLAGWMLEKGCIQQADALLASLPLDFAEDGGE